MEHDRRQHEHDRLDVNLNVAVTHGVAPELMAELAKLITKPILKVLEKIMATQAEHATELRALREQNEKSRAEVLAKIKDLEDALAAGGGTTPEVDEAMAALKASVQTDDDIVPDPAP